MHAPNNILPRRIGFEHGNTRQEFDMLQLFDRYRHIVGKGKEHFQLIEKVVDLEKAIEHIKKLNGMYVPLNMLNPFYDSCVGLVVDDDKLPALMEKLKYFDHLHVLITSRGKLKKTLYKVFCTNE